MPVEEIRWRQRYENYQKALKLYNKSFDQDLETYSELEQMGLIQQFEIVSELAWKTLKDILYYQGVYLKIDTPKEILKKSFDTRLIKNHDLWLDILKTRNNTSHVYATYVMNETISKLKDFKHVFNSLDKKLKEFI